VRQKCPLLLEEMTKIACLPRNNLGWGWMVRARAAVASRPWVAPWPFRTRVWRGSRSGTSNAVQRRGGAPRNPQVPMPAPHHPPPTHPVLLLLPAAPLCTPSPCP
jgi:hypothetical protein